MSKFFSVPIETVPDAELFGHMVRIGLALSAELGRGVHGKWHVERENAIQMYDECVAELNRRIDARKKAGMN